MPIVIGENLETALRTIRVNLDAMIDQAASSIAGTNCANSSVNCKNQPGNALYPYKQEGLTTLLLLNWAGPTLALELPRSCCWRSYLAV